MNIARLLIAPALLVAMALPAAAEKIPLKAISAYLNSITTAQTGFVQTNADGSKTTGKLFIKRPGRARFEYDPPEQSLVMASGGQVAIFDAKSNQPPDQYPLVRTPLNLILGNKIDLSRAKMVVGHTEQDGTTRVVAQDPDHPEYGQIELVFIDNPVTLRQWIITDDMGNQTKITLGDLTQGINLKPSLFDITAETKRRSQ